ncbi:MAG: hypothetical protein ACLPVY_27265 [Acidimicrobiia bacterium]
MHDTDPREGAEPENETARTSASIPEGRTRVISGSERLSIERAPRIDADFWATPPTQPRLVAPKVEAQPVDDLAPDDIGAVPVPEAIRVEETLYNIAAIPVGEPAIEAVLFENPAEYHLAAVVGTPDVEGPAQDWEEDAAGVSPDDDTTAIRTTAPQIDTRVLEGPTNYYSAALRIADPIEVCVVESPTQNRIEDEAAGVRPTEPQLEADVLLEGPAQDWSQNAAAPVSDNASSTGDGGPATLELVISPQPATTVSEIEAEPLLVAAVEPGTWALAAAIEPCLRPEPAARDDDGTFDRDEAPK